MKNRTIISITLILSVITIVSLKIFYLNNQHTIPTTSDTPTATPSVTYDWIKPTPRWSIQMDVVPTLVNTSTWKVYQDPVYNYSIKLPEDWYIKESREDIYDKPTTQYYSRKAKQDSPLAPQMPHFTIGDYAVYSTAGGVCANQTCNNFGMFAFVINDKEHEGIIEEARDPSNNFLYYATQIKLQEFQITSKDDYQINPHVTVFFKNRDEAQTIINILSTIR